MRTDADQRDVSSEPIPFSGEPTLSGEPTPTSSRSTLPFTLTGLPDSAEQVLDAISQMSRRISDLARELNCLGYFDDPDDDRPRAA